MFSASYEYAGNCSSTSSVTECTSCRVPLSARRRFSSSASVRERRRVGPGFRAVAARAYECPTSRQQRLSSASCRFHHRAEMRKRSRPCAWTGFAILWKKKDCHVLVGYRGRGIHETEGTQETRAAQQKVARHGVIVSEVGGIDEDIRRVPRRPIAVDKETWCPGYASIRRNRAGSTKPEVCRIVASVVPTHADSALIVHRDPGLVVIRSQDVPTKYVRRLREIDKNRRRPGRAR
jgi:hypothetical protein